MSGPVDPILGLFLERRRERKGTPSGTWLELLTPSATPADFEWLSERFARNVVHESVQDVLDLPWSAIFTSTIDPQLLRRLETCGRQPEPIVTAEQYPRVARSTRRPPVYHLFGRANETAEAARCPRSVNELARRQIRTSLLLARIPETTTSAGVLVVDGFTAGSDWLGLDALLSALPLNEGLRVLWFGASDSINSPLFQDLVEAGTVLTDSRKLPVVIADLKSRDLQSSFAALTSDEPGIISLPDGFVSVSPSLRLRVEASAIIVDDEWTQRPAPLDLSAEEDTFRRFHGDLGGTRGLIDGIGRGFAIERPFERQLRTSVRSALEKRADIARTVVLHGQSGTGKTVAFARLAYRFRVDEKVPVLFAAGRIPEVADVDAFCTEAERQGASSTLVLCDCNQPIERYLALSGALSSRGRRVAVVGTSYRLSLRSRHRSLDLIEAPTTVTDAEHANVNELMRKFGREQISRAPKIGTADTDHVFALLYRTIAPGRQRLIAGVSGEARSAEEALRQRSKNVPQVAQGLAATSSRAASATLFEVEAVAEAFGTDAPGRLIDYVMAAGRLDIYVPLNLLLRVLRAQDPSLTFAAMARLFQDVDLFRWRYGDQEKSELLVGPRLRLEAELICRRRLADPARELDCLVDLIASVRQRSVDQYSEVRFLSDLLQKLGRDGPREDAYADGYLRVAKALTSLRIEHGLEDASIMLQESSFRRAWLRARKASDTIAERDVVLEEARSVVEEAIRKVTNGQLRAARRTRENLFVERASIYGFLAVGHSVHNAPADVVWSDYLAARTAANRAMGVAPNYFPYDVALWTPADILAESQSTASLSPPRRGELVADIYSVLDRIDPSQLPPSQLERFHVRRAKIGDVLKDAELKADALKSLEAINPAVALYLEARSICLEAFQETPVAFTDEVRDKARRAADFIEQKLSVASTDPRCLRLLLEFVWIGATGERLLRGERRPIPHDMRARQKLLQIVQALNKSSNDAADFSMRYLEAVLAWVCRDVQYALDTWRSLAHDTEFEDSRRVHRRLFVADASGNPSIHRGRLIASRSQGHWQVAVEGVNARINLLERDFYGTLLKPGYEVRDFAIAFNYLGPIADPLTRYEVAS
ncbi:hypothetical protein [Polyangium mundeleinium]|uniref:AAA+ ATPase domain-containing protein n=1 Tax=Polyangium mundeleinium TaxID=2995306 RepID=A0ABT5EGM6_9BACT|nr:hypothetical protein [Polyangium mundeleinium]MDC0740978.1 hypothetical protein [Polyangium mundeleinium]